MMILAHPRRSRALSRPLGSRRRSRAPVVRAPHPVFIVYSDVASARHAMTHVSKLLQTSHPNHELMPMLWRFDQLDQPRWREMALREAARAVTIVLAMNATATLSAGTDAWLTALTAQQRGATISALALIGGEAWTISLQHTATKAAIALHPRGGPTSRAVAPIETHQQQPEIVCAA
jgi:hypothetical protein